MNCLPVFGLFEGDIPAMLNLTIVLFYSALLVVVTSVITMRSRDPDPMLGGRNMPWWLVGASIIGTNLSNLSFLTFPTIGFVLDKGVILANLMDILAGLIVCFLFVAFLRKTRDASIYTLLRDRFGMGMSLYVSGAFIVFKILYAGIMLCLVGKALHFMTGVEVGSIILTCGTLVIFYTYMTGIEGVMWTDLFQTVLLVGASILALIFIGGSVADSFTQQSLGWGDLRSMLEAGAEKENLSSDSVVITLLFFITSAVSYFISDQTIGQRYLVARSDAHAKKGLLFASICMPLFATIFLAIGVALYLYYTLNPTLLTPEVLADKDGIFAYYIANNFPNGLLGLIIIGILAAAMSTIDTGINSSSTVFCCNFWDPFVKKTSSSTLRNMSIMRNCSLAFGALAIIVGYLIHTSSESLLTIFWKGNAFILDSVLGLFLLMRISKRVGKKSGITAFAAGMLFIAWATFTCDIDHPWANDYHYMLGLPGGTAIMVVVGLIMSRFMDESVQEGSAPFIHSEKARESIARKRKRAKKNIFADSLRPKSFYQVYAGIALAAVLMLLFDGGRMGFSLIDARFLVASAISLAAVVLGPFIIDNFTSKRYLGVNLTLLTIALPLGASVAMFLNPGAPEYGYLFLVAVMGMGTMVGWTMLALGTMLSASVASLLALWISSQAGVPGEWMFLSLATLGIFVFYAMDAAKERSSEERALGKVHTILKRVGDLTMRHSIDLSHSGKQINMQDVSRLAHTANDIASMIDALKGATDTDPEEGQLELSVEESLTHALTRIPLRDKVTVLCEQDFKVMGCRDAFENIFYHLLENATYYIDRGEASAVVCVIDAKRRTFSISNDGPAVRPVDVPYIFDLGYSQKDGLGLGLTYCKKMLEGMRAGIRLISKPKDKWVIFKIYFPFSYDGRRLDDDVSCQNDVQL